MNGVIVILGPTASGKTSISIKLASEILGEIISCDSMQIYKGLNIGTAKPLPKEMCGIKHYLIDEVNPDEEFSVAKYQALALQYIMDVKDMGKIPIIVGGTGLYINSLIYNYCFTETICDWDLRESLTREALEKGNDHLHQKLKLLDEEAAHRIHENDTKRMIRAIEVYMHTGKTQTEIIKESRKNPSPHKFLIFGLTMSREKLYSRIDQRVDKMFDLGLIDEVKEIVRMGYDKNLIAMQALGYKEILSFLKGEISLEDAKYTIKRDTRRYAKRQMTWFRRIENVVWIDTDQSNNEEDFVKNIKNCIETSGIIL